MTTETTQTTMTGMDLAQRGPVLDLAALQREMSLPDGDFARVVRFEYSGSSWGKIKNGTFSGNAAKALGAVSRSLASAKTGGMVETEDGVVILPHVRDAIDAVTIARTATDEHRMVLIVGHSGGGKSCTARMLASRFSGRYMHAHPSWARSYMQCLTEMARGLGLSSDYRSAGEAERRILDNLGRSPSLVVIDEANHFSRDAINFLKTILNETRCCLVLCTLPNHLARMNAEHAEESRQLLRRSVAIIHIPPVSSADVAALHCSLAPEVSLNGYAPALASAANRHHRLDTVVRILQEANPADEQDVPRAVERVERQIRAVVRE
jgi:energy-coupling factor transporter ATP-binding protein EcfA2